MRQPAGAARSTISSGQPKRRSSMPSASSASRRRGAHRARGRVSAHAAAAPQLEGQRAVGQPGVQRPRAARPRARAEHEVGAPAERPGRPRAGRSAGSSEPSQSMKHTTSRARPPQPGEAGGAEAAHRLDDDLRAERPRRVAAEPSVEPLSTTIGR